MIYGFTADGQLARNPICTPRHRILCRDIVFCIIYPSIYQWLNTKNAIPFLTPRYCINPSMYMYMCVCTAVCIYKYIYIYTYCHMSVLFCNVLTLICTKCRVKLRSCDSVSVSWFVVRPIAEPILTLFYFARPFMGTFLFSLRTNFCCLRRYFSKKAYNMQTHTQIYIYILKTFCASVRIR